jgi:tRNA modification GTPase
MIPDPQDTIVALSSAPGPGGRAIIRLSGPHVLACALTVFTSEQAIAPDRRRCYLGELRLPDVSARLPADLHFWPGPRTYTGQALVELHMLSCPPLVERLLAELLNAGCRAARPGEFTLRAFLAGKLDLTQAEAVLAVIEAASPDELKRSLAQLAGGVAQPLQLLRDDLLNLLADVEAALDFTEEDIRFVHREEILGRLAKGLAHLILLQKQLDQRAMGGRTFRVVLVGRPNAGKTSLFNALAPGSAALVSAEPGTTRDYLVRRLDVQDVTVELVDTAGWQDSNGAVESQAQQLSRQQAQEADLLLLCLEAGKTVNPKETSLLSRPGTPAVVGVATKCDLVAAPPDYLATSAVTGIGIEALRSLLAERARARALPALAPSLSRCRHHVDACRDHLQRAHEAVLFEEPSELLAVELRGGLDELGEMVGAVYTEDLLDRVFSRFCIGK